jgi:hypothetical protein
MRIELDHLFVCTAPGAQEAERFVQFGLLEGPPNQHLGQGTACRRFPFANAMIELLWVNNPSEAQNQTTRSTLLWERWAARDRGASPFGICLRPANPKETGEPPFPAWEYRPSFLPAPFVMHIGEAGVDEPMWVYMSFMKRAQREHWFNQHPAGIHEITALTLTTTAPLRSTVSQKLVEGGVLSTRTGKAHLLEIEFDGKPRNERIDFRPHLPIIFQL